MILHTSIQYIRSANTYLYIKESMIGRKLGEYAYKIYRKNDHDSERSKKRKQKLLRKLKKK